MDEMPLTNSPTAHTLPADVAATLDRPLLAPGLGLGTRFHALPFQRRIKVLGLLVKQLAQPTAQALRADTAATLARLPLGLGTRFHALPFQCRIKVLGLLVKQLAQPTAQAFLAEVAATPCRSPLTTKDAAGPADLVRAAAAVAGAIPAITPATNSGTAETATEHVASRGVRTGTHPPPQEGPASWPLPEPGWSAAHIGVTAATGHASPHEP